MAETLLDVSFVEDRDRGDFERGCAPFLQVFRSIENAASLQNQVVDHLREYIEDLQDELQWDASFKKTYAQLAAAARRAKQEIAEGYANPMDYDQL